MEEFVMYSMVLVAFGLCFGYPIYRRKRQSRAWKDAADSLSLDFMEGGIREMPQLSGRHRGRPISAQVRSRRKFFKLRGNPKIWNYDNIFEASLEADCFQGFSMVEKKMVDDVATIFGGEDVEVGIAEIDSTFRLTGSVDGRVTDVLAHQRVRRMFRTLTDQYRIVAIEGGALRLEHRESLSDPDDVIRRIERVVAVAQKLDAAAGVDEESKKAGGDWTGQEEDENLFPEPEPSGVQ